MGADWAGSGKSNYKYCYFGFGPVPFIIVPLMKKNRLGLLVQHEEYCCKSGCVAAAVNDWKNILMQILRFMAMVKNIPRC